MLNLIFVNCVLLFGVASAGSTGALEDPSCISLLATKSTAAPGDNSTTCTRAGTFNGTYSGSTAIILACGVCTTSSCPGANLDPGCADPTGCMTHIANPNCPLQPGANQCKPK